MMDRLPRSLRTFFLLVDLTLRCQGNLVSSVDNKLAMPYLLSVLPPISPLHEELRGSIVERPLPIAAKLPRDSPGGDAGPLYVTVLGGSLARGGLALDPITISGFELSVGMPITVGQVHEGPLSPIRRSDENVHLQIEMLPPKEFHVKNPRKMRLVRPRLTARNDGTEIKPSKYSGGPNTRLEMEGLYGGLFSAATESGFLIGEHGTIPWLCRVERSRVHFMMPCQTDLRKPKPRQRKPLRLNKVEYPPSQPETLPVVEPEPAPEPEPEPEPKEKLSSDLESNDSEDQKYKSAPERVEKMNHGARKFSFRQRAGWTNYKGSGWRRGGFIPGGFKGDLKKKDLEEYQAQRKKGFQKDE